MSYSILSIPIFNKQVKHLAKKYPSLKQDLATLIENIEFEPLQGTALGNNFYKLRMAITS